MQKVVLITGAARGIGAAIAELAASNGYLTYASMRDPHGRNREFAEQLQKHSRVIELDVCNDISVQGAVDTIVSDCGRIDFVVNNAGWAISGAMEEINVGQLQKEFDTNFFGPMRVSQAVAPHMRKQKQGAIIQISSISGLALTPLFGAYQSSKWALEAASEVMAFELGHFGVRVLMLEPGNVDTDVLVELTPAELGGTSAYAALREQMARSRPLGAPMLSAKEVAVAVLAAMENESTPLRTVIGDSTDLVGHRQRLSNVDYWNWLRDSRKLNW
jgi:NAD(P)-dependent dehydrogenase (short-subunit alcohol dehydrogenase family)